MHNRVAGPHLGGIAEHPELGWLYGIAGNVVSADRRRTARELRATGRLGGRRLLDTDDIARLAERIDAASGGARSARRCTAHHRTAS